MTLFQSASVVLNLFTKLINVPLIMNVSSLPVRDTINILLAMTRKINEKIRN